MSFEWDELDDERDTTVYRPEKSPQVPLTQLGPIYRPPQPRSELWLMWTLSAAAVLSVLVLVFVVPGWFGPGPAEAPLDTPPPASPYVGVPDGGVRPSAG